MPDTPIKPGTTAPTTNVTFDSLPRFYTWREVYALYPTEDEFIDAFCDGTLPDSVRRAVEESLDPARLTNWLLRRVVRQQTRILAIWEEDPQ